MSKAKVALFYPANFPVHLEKKLIELLTMMDHQTLDVGLKNQKQFNRILLDILKSKKIFDGIKPSNWWLNFILIRHKGAFRSAFVKTASQYLIKTRIRSLSGVVALTLFTEGTGCPFHCVYCPNEPGIPKSYLSDEPAIMRAIRHGFDPYKQTLNRLIMFYLSGHPIDKIEIIIKGGTFSFYSQSYREEFVKNIFDACNSNIKKIIATGTIQRQFSSSLTQSQKINETAQSRIIGINIETRPDYINKNELLFLRCLGVTHVEMGVQMPDDVIYKLIKRGHTVKDVVVATRQLKDAGFKVGYHLMPNLPGSSPQKDSMLMKKTFINEDFKPDHLKLYPTTVTPYTLLGKWYKDGIYKPYSLAELIRILIDFKSRHVPSWVRIGRLTRDITTTMMEYRQFAPNLREDIQNTMKKNKKHCHCIRCREIRDTKMAGEPQLRIIGYTASKGKEYFFEYTDEKMRSLGFLRLRIPDQPFIPSLKDTAIIRELHVYGQAASIGERNNEKTQHKSYGKMLLKKAEDTARKEHVGKIAVISGVGVREYYLKQGYGLIDNYMIKDLTSFPTGKAG